MTPAMIRWLQSLALWLTFLSLSALAVNPASHTVRWFYWQHVAGIEQLIDYGQYEGEADGAWPARDTFRVGEWTTHVSKNRYPIDLKWVRFQERKYCALSGGGDFTPVGPASPVLEIAPYPARTWQLNGPWKLEYASHAVDAADVRRAGGWLPCCERSTVSVSPLEGRWVFPEVVRTAVLNDGCPPVSIYHYIEATLNSAETTSN